MPDPASVSDDELLRAAGCGDEAAFNRLVRRHADRARILACRMLGSVHEAEEVLQEVFWRVWRAAPGWRPGEATFSTWLHRVVVNACIDRERRAKLRRWLPFGDVSEPASDDVGVDDAMEAHEELRAVLEDMRALPPRQRAALLLSAEGGRSNREIAAILGVSEKALESLLVRSRRTLRVRARDREGEPR